MGLENNVKNLVDR